MQFEFGREKNIERKIEEKMNRMRDDQEFNIQFVKIVEKERTLYDKSMPEYRSKEEHEKVWMKISEQINESGKTNSVHFS